MIDRATVAALVGPGTDSFADREALRSIGTGLQRRYDYDRLRTDAHRTGNFLSHRGVRDGRLVGVADDPVPEVVLAVLGAALTGGLVHLAPPRAFDGRAVVVPVSRVDSYDLPAGGSRIGYGGSPDDPAVVHFEEEMWSENPTFPPPSVVPADPLLATPDRRLSHGEVLSTARRVVDANDLDADATVAVRASLARPGTVAAGLVAPLLAGATIVLPGDDGSETSTDSDVGTHAVAPSDTNVPETARIVPTA